jgi:uncharacterized membrane protein
MPNLSNEKYNQVSTEKKLAVVSEAENYINAFNQRNLQSILTNPIVHKKQSTGSVVVNIKIDAATLATKGLLFLAQGHPEYLAPKVAHAIVQDSGWSTPAYQYFGQQVQQAIDSQLAPTAENFNSLLLPVTMDLADYNSLYSPALVGKSLFLNLDLEFGLIK